MIPEAMFVSLEKLSRRAAADSLAAIGAHVDEDDRFDALAVHLLSVGVRAVEEFDPDLAGGSDDPLGVGVSPERYAFRRMRGWNAARGAFTNGPTIDWLRATESDTRFDPPGSVFVTQDGVVPDLLEDAEAVTAERLEVALEDACRNREISTRALWALHHIGVRRAMGEPFVVIADRLRMDASVVRAELDAARGEIEGVRAVSKMPAQRFDRVFEWAAAA